VVVGPDELPVLRDPEDILASPETATLSAIAHHDDMEAVTSVAVTPAESGDEITRADSFPRRSAHVWRTL
jgi:hypothetical protein